MKTPEVIKTNLKAEKIRKSIIISDFPTNNTWEARSKVLEIYCKLLQVNVSGWHFYAIELLIKPKSIRLDAPYTFDDHKIKLATILKLHGLIIDGIDTPVFSFEHNSASLPKLEKTMFQSF